MEDSRVLNFGRKLKPVKAPGTVLPEQPGKFAPTEFRKVHKFWGIVFV